VQGAAFLITHAANFALLRRRKRRWPATDPASALGRIEPFARAIIQQENRLVVRALPAPAA
jgi:hypothetical protein